MALPATHRTFSTTVDDLTRAYARVQDRTNWEGYRDPFE